MKYWKHQGQQSASETWCYLSEKHLEGSHLGLGDHELEIGLTAPKVKAGGRVGLAKRKAPIPALGVDGILCNGLLFTFTSLNFRPGLNVAFYMRRI